MAGVETLRKLALALPEAEEKPHFERASFRVRGKIFATLSVADKQAVLKLPIPDQTVLVGSEPDIFFLAGWAHQGWTGVHLAKIKKQPLEELVTTAWRNVAPKKLIASFDEKR